MQSIKYVQNGKGEAEAVPVKSAYGISLKNSAGEFTDKSQGFQIAMDTMTFIRKDVIKQKFFTVEGGLTDYTPIEIGNGAFAQNILTNVEFLTGGNFESGQINTGSGSSRIAQADASVASKTVKIANWSYGISYNLFEIEQALMANNWDAIAAKERSRKKTWDLGIQDLVFLGSKSNSTEFAGILTNSNVNTNLSLITKPISTMTAAELSAFVAGLISAYFTNSNKTSRPDTFLIPQSDFFGLQAMTPGTVGTYPVPLIEYLEKAFKAASQNKNFRILPSPYCDASTNTDWGINKQMYMLYKNDRETLRMDIPVDYTVTLANTMNNFNFQSAAYGQFTGVNFYRNLEGLLFQY